MQTLFGKIVVFSPPRLTSFPTNKIKNLLFPFFTVFATCMHPFYIKNHVNVCKCSLIVESVRGSDKGECVPSPVSWLVAWYEPSVLTYLHTVNILHCEEKANVVIFHRHLGVVVTSYNILSSFRLIEQVWCLQGSIWEFGKCCLLICSCHSGPRNTLHASCWKDTFNTLAKWI